MPESSPRRTLIIACSTVIEEILPLIPDNFSHQAFDFGLHVKPDKLRSSLQEAIDAQDGQYETILLGYGLCSNAIIGLHASDTTLVVPRVDDCIAIFLGSKKAYQEQFFSQPGTYYLTKGWIEAGDTPFTDYERLETKHGPEKAQWMMKLVLENYHRLALINTGQYELERYRQYSRRVAERFDLHYEEIPGSDVLVRKMLTGPWDEEFMVIPPGQTVKHEDYWSKD